MYVCMNGCMVQKLLSPRCLLQCYYSYINFLVGFGFMHGVFVVFIEYLALRFDFHQNIIDEVHRKCLSVAKSLKTLMTSHINTDTVLQLTLALIYNIVCETMSTLNAFISIDDWIWFTQQKKSVFVFFFLDFHTLPPNRICSATKQNCPDTTQNKHLRLCCVKQWNIKQC